MQRSIPSTLTRVVTAVTISAAIGLPLSAARADDGEDNDQVLLKFSTVGDSRQDPTAPDPSTLPLSGQDATWLQNTKAWSRIMDTIDSQKSDMLVFNGDMIMGYGNTVAPADTSLAGILKSDVLKTYQQYGFWRGMVAGLMERGTYVVPVAGNHEVQWKAGGKKAQAANENAWRANMADLILDDARFQSVLGEVPSNENVGDTRATAPGDGAGGATLATDQSKLSYSFDFRGSHFAIVNTDPVGNDAHAPTNWLAADLAAAKGRGVQHSFVFGHKPAFTYYYGAGASAPLPAAPSGLDNDLVARNAFWDVIEQYGAVYFCGHEHIFNVMQPRAAVGGKAYQVLVGSGGSPFEAKPTDTTLVPSDRYYAWATVKVLKNGKVKITAYGFDDHFGATKVIQTLTVRP
ncbi:MAG TPA: metallophosphoesterase [Polyangiales bacterium]